MSGFTRDTRYYGDRLVYEALSSKWSSYHRHCGCAAGWDSHLEPAGFEIAREGNGFVAITGTGLTDGVDESALTANALWEAVTGTPGTQGWVERVRVIDRAKAPASAPAPRHARTAKIPEAASPAQLAYLRKLVVADPSKFATQLAIVTASARTDGAVELQKIDSLTKALASKLISALVGPAQ